jgi:hypothetical protein
MKVPFCDLLKAGMKFQRLDASETGIEKPGFFAKNRSKFVLFIHVLKGGLRYELVRIITFAHLKIMDK